MKFTAPYFLDSNDIREIDSAERKILLQLFNAVNDQNFDNYKARGAIAIYTFEQDDLGYAISFEGFDLKLIFSLIDSRFYFRYKEKLVDAFVLKTWSDIDDWISGKNFNVSDIGLDPLFNQYRGKVENKD